MYSAARHTVVPDPSSEIQHRARVYKGAVVLLAGGFIWKAFARGLTGLLFLAATAVLVRLFFAGSPGFV
jgi:hypothetical protein